MIVPPGPTEVTQLLSLAKQGDDQALHRLMPMVYDELRRVARGQLRGHIRNTLDTTALVHEAFLKLSGASSPAWKDRGHFYAVAATAMRQILIDHARRRQSLKRGGERVRVELQEGQAVVREQAEQLLAIDEALQQLAELNPRWVQVVECRFFAGLTEEETARSLGVAERTVRRDWSKARAWLFRALKPEALAS